MGGGAGQRALCPAEGAAGAEGAGEGGAAERAVTIVPRLNRLLLFWSDTRCPHEVRRPSSPPPSCRPRWRRAAPRSCSGWRGLEYRRVRCVSACRHGNGRPSPCELLLRLQTSATGSSAMLVCCGAVLADHVYPWSCSPRMPSQMCLNAWWQVGPLRAPVAGPRLAVTTWHHRRAIRISIGNLR